MIFRTQQPAQITALIIRYASLLGVITAAAITLVGGYYFISTYFSAIAPETTTESSIVTYNPQPLKLKQYEQIVLGQVEKQKSADEIGREGLPNPFENGAGQ